MKGLLDRFKKNSEKLKSENSKISYENEKKIDIFPDKLDNADVLFYTEKGDYGTVNYTDGRICEYVKYLAICSYLKDSGYYLFLCNDKCDVIQDDLCDSIEQCKKFANSRKKDITWKEK